MVIVSGGFQCVSHVAPSTSRDDGSIVGKQKWGAASRSRPNLSPQAYQSQPRPFSLIWKDMNPFRYLLCCAILQFCSLPALSPGVPTIAE